jgi:glycine/D-amino acid oxidase-like deaminating enzyme
LDLRSGTPLWLIQDGVPFTYPPLRSPLSVDVAVVGAGVTGAAVAWELSRAGFSVAVVDRRDVAMGSSAASTGLLLYETDTSLDELSAHIGDAGAARVYQLGSEAIDTIETFCAEPGRTCGFSRRPSLYVASRRTHVAALQREFERRTALGYQVEWLTRAAIASRHGFDAPAAIYTGGTAQVDCYLLTHHLLAAAHALGATIHDRTTASVPQARNGLLVSETDRGAAISARSVVWATGYEVDAAMKPAKAHFATTWVLATEPIDDLSSWTDRYLLWETARPYHYARSTDDNRLIVGGQDEPCAECHRSKWWSQLKTRRLLKRAATLFPALPLEAAYDWAGTFSITDDGLPVIREMDGHPGVWLTLGYGGNGITFGLIAARLIREALQGERTDDLRLFGADGGP